MKSRFAKLAVMLGLMLLVLVGFSILLSAPKVAIVGACLLLVTALGIVLGALAIVWWGIVMRYDEGD